MNLQRGRRLVHFLLVKLIYQFVDRLVYFQKTRPVSISTCPSRY